jgi:hypothetical protein
MDTQACRQRSVWIVVLVSMGALVPTGRAAQTTRPDDEQIQELLGGLRSGSYERRQAAIKEVVAIGEPAVPGLLEMILDPGGSFEAQNALRLMGPKARAALPRLIEVAQARPPSRPADSQPAGSSPRLTALIVLQGMGWASGELIPVLQKIADDPQEEERVRTVAVSGLGKMGRDAVPILRKYADGPEGQFRETARSVLSVLLQEQGIQTREQYYTSLIEADPFGPKVPEYLMSTKGIINAGRTHPLTEKIKAAYRARLKEKPDPELALALATIIQRQLAGTQIEWAAPTDRGSSQWLRENPAESYVTMAEALTSGFEQAEKGSDLRQTIGVGLARLRLLQGDWQGMNRVLTQLAWAAIPAESRAFLAAPPVQWDKDLRKQWTACDERMRSGDCGLVLRIEKDGKGLRGAHVLVKEWKPPGNVWYSGIASDTLFFAPQPLVLYGREAFGYGGGDRAMTRYAVTDDTGEVKFEKLPEIHIKIEVLVPTGNFAEAGRGWDLWMETAPGKMKRAIVGGDPEAVDRSEPPAVAELESGKTIRYPRLVVLPQLDLSVDDWSGVDPKTFEISWPELPAQPGEQITYELEMILTGPDEHPGLTAEYLRPVESSRETVSTNRWAVGAKGVGGKKLYPGNLYAFGVVACDQGGKILSRSPRKRVWVPWGYRVCDPPMTVVKTDERSPIQVETWFRGSFNYGNGRSETLEERVARFLREYPKAFEREYVEVGKAWLDWHAGRTADAEAQLKKLVEGLPEGSVPRNTAVWLLGQMKEGKSPVKRLILVGSSGAPMEGKPGSAPANTPRRARRM